MDNGADSLAPPPVEPPRGMFPGRLDANGRLKLPAAFQQYFSALPEKKLFVTSLEGRIAKIYPIAAWRENEQFFRGYQAHPDARKRVAFIANDLGADAEPDAQGRLTFPAKLRKALDLDNTELHLYSERGHVVVMSAALYEEFRRKSLETAAQDLELLDQAGLK
jgi:MraZ protein